MLDIALPAFSAERFIGEMLDSIHAQTLSNYRILIRDDASSDGTSDIIQQSIKKFGGRLQVLNKDNGLNLGVIGNYNAVLESTSAPFVALADADDIWLPNRLLQARDALILAEKEFGQRTPLAVCTDSCVIDDGNRLVASSYWNWAKMKPKANLDVGRVAMESIGLGPTMTINRALLDIALPIPR